MTTTQASDKRIDHYKIDVISISCPEWFKREDFKGMLNKSARGDCQRPLTWHTEGEPDEWSDVFTFYDSGDGTDTDVIPEDIWDEICSICEERNVNYALVKILNL